MQPTKLEDLTFDSPAHLRALQSFLSQPRETLPRTTLVEARRAAAWTAGQLGMELIETEPNTPSFLLLPGDGEPPDATLFASWHAESMPVIPAAVEGGERLAMAAGLGALLALSGRLRVSVVAAPGASQGSLVLAETLARHRARLAAPCAFWVRVAPAQGRRRRVFLGARGRVVLGLWGSEANPYRVRDELVRDLTDQAYGPRPLDFELLRKLAQASEPLDFVEEALGREEDRAPGANPSELLRAALFDPRGHVFAPQVRHPDRPQAWIVIEITENMEPAEVHERARTLAHPAKVEMAEAFPWDRLNIHHPAIQAEIAVSRSKAEGAEIWPMAPWCTPCGVFTRALGTPLAEWAVPLPTGIAIRFPDAEALGALEREIAELLLRGARTFAGADVP
jgi:hypothetical protein